MRSNEAWNLKEITISSEKAQKNERRAETMMHNDVRRIVEIVFAYNPLAFIRTAYWDAERVIASDTSDDKSASATSLAFVRFLIKIVVSTEYIPEKGFSQNADISESDWKKSLKYFNQLINHTDLLVDNTILSTGKDGDTLVALQEYMQSYYLPLPSDKVLLSARKQELRSKVEPFISYIEATFDASVDTLLDELEKLSIQGYDGIFNFGQELAAYQNDLAMAQAEYKVKYPNKKPQELIKLIIEEKGWAQRDQVLQNAKDGFALFNVQFWSTLSEHDCQLLSISAGSLGGKNTGFPVSSDGLDDTLFLDVGNACFSFEGRFIFDRAFVAIKRAVLQENPQVRAEWEAKEDTKRKLLPFSILSGVLSHLDYSFSQPYGTSFFDVVYERNDARVNVCIPSCHALPLSLNPFSNMERTADAIEQEKLCYDLSAHLSSPLILIDDRRAIAYPLTLDAQGVMRLSLMQLCSYVDDFGKISAIKLGLHLPSQPIKEKHETQSKPFSFASVLQNVADGKKSFDESSKAEDTGTLKTEEPKSKVENEEEKTEEKTEEKKVSSPFSFASMLQNVAEGKDALFDEETETKEESNNTETHLADEEEADNTETPVAKEEEVDNTETPVAKEEESDKTETPVADEEESDNTETQLAEEEEVDKTETQLADEEESDNTASQTDSEIEQDSEEIQKTTIIDEKIEDTTAVSNEEKDEIESDSEEREDAKSLNSSQESIKLIQEQETGTDDEVKEKKTQSAPFSFASMLQNVAEGKNALDSEEDKPLGEVENLHKRLDASMPKADTNTEILKETHAPSDDSLAGKINLINEVLGEIDLNDADLESYGVFDEDEKESDEPLEDEIEEPVIPTSLFDFDDDKKEEETYPIDKEDTLTEEQIIFDDLELESEREEAAEMPLDHEIVQPVQAPPTPPKKEEVKVPKKTKEAHIELTPQQLEAIHAEDYDEDLENMLLPDEDIDEDEINKVEVEEEKDTRDDREKALVSVFDEDLDSEQPSYEENPDKSALSDDERDVSFDNLEDEAVEEENDKMDKIDMDAAKTALPKKIQEILDKIEDVENSTFLQITEEGDMELLQGMASVIDQIRLVQESDGKDKMFNIPNKDMTIVLTIGQDDLLRNWDRKNNIGAIMYTNHKDSWRALTLKYSKSGKLLVAREVEITKDDFEPVDWKFVVSTGQRFLDQKKEKYED